MKIIHTLSTLQNNLKIRKEYAIFPYQKLTYSILVLLRPYCIKSIYRINCWILVYLSYNKKNLTFRFFSSKNKKNILTYAQLEKIIKINQNKHGLVFTPKGIYSLEQILRLKQGGVLFCLIYYSI